MTSGCLFLPLRPVGGAMAPHNGPLRAREARDRLTYRGRSDWGPDRQTGGSSSRLPDVQAPNERLICENNWEKVGQSRLMKDVLLVTNSLQGELFDTESVEVICV